MNIDRTEGGKCFATIDGERVEITRRLANKAVRLGLSEREVCERNASNNRRASGATRSPW